MKISSLIAAVLFAGAAMSGAAYADEGSSRDEAKIRTLAA